MSINTMALLSLLQDKPVKITMKDGMSFVCEPLHIVLDQELESYSVYIIDGLSRFKSDTYTDVYTPDILTIELLADSYGCALVPEETTRRSGRIEWETKKTSRG